MIKYLGLIIDTAGQIPQGLNNIGRIEIVRLVSALYFTFVLHPTYRVTQITAA
jgi:hypothetical protein